MSADECEAHEQPRPRHIWRPKLIGQFRGEPVYVQACSACGLRYQTYQAIKAEQEKTR